MALLQKTVAPFSEHKGGVGSFLKIPRSNSVVNKTLGSLTPKFLIFEPCLITWIIN